MSSSSEIEREIKEIESKVAYAKSLLEEIRSARPLSIEELVVSFREESMPMSGVIPIRRRQQGQDSSDTQKTEVEAGTAVRARRVWFGGGDLKEEKRNRIRKSISALFTLYPIAIAGIYSLSILVSNLKDPQIIRGEDVHPPESLLPEMVAAGFIAVTYALVATNYWRDARYWGEQKLLPLKGDQWKRLMANRYEKNALTLFVATTGIAVSNLITLSRFFLYETPFISIVSRMTILLSVAGLLVFLSIYATNKYFVPTSFES